MGDFHQQFTSNDKNVALLCSIAQDLALEQCVRIPTRGSNILDLLFINSPSTVSHVDVVDNLPQTDHDLIVFTFKQEGIHRLLYNCKKADFDIYRNTLCSVPWDLAKSSTVNDWWYQWKDIFLLW